MDPTITDCSTAVEAETAAPVALGDLCPIEHLEALVRNGAPVPQMIQVAGIAYPLVHVQQAAAAVHAALSHSLREGKATAWAETTLRALHGRRVRPYAKIGAQFDRTKGSVTRHKQHGFSLLAEELARPGSALIRVCEANVWIARRSTANPAPSGSWLRRIVARLRGWLDPRGLTPDKEPHPEVAV